MAISKHPMSALKGTDQGRALMAQVRGHRGGSKPSDTKGAPVAHDLTASGRRKLASTGVARPDGSYPISTQADVTNAVKDWIRTGRNTSVRQWIEKRVRALDLTMPAEFGAPKRTDEMDVAKTITARNSK